LYRVNSAIWIDVIQLGDVLDIALKVAHPSRFQYTLL